MTKLSVMPKAIQEAGAQAAKDREVIFSGKDPSAPEATAQADTGGGPAAGDGTGQPSTATETDSTRIERLNRNLSDLQRRFDTQEGRHGTQVQQYQRTIDDMKSQLDEQTKLIGEQSARIAELTKGGASQPTAAASASIPAPGTPEFDAMIGPDLLDEMGPDLARKAFARLTGVLQGAVAPVLRQVETLQDQNRKREEADARTAEERAARDRQTRLDRIWNDVDRIQPGARAANGDSTRNVKPEPDFLAFCEDRDESTGITNRNIAASAFNDAFNAEPGTALYDAAIKAVAKVFVRYEAWKQSRNGQAPRPGERRVDVPDASSHTAPPKTTGGPTPEGEKPTVKQSDYDAFAKDHRLNPAKYSIEEVNKRNAEYREAAREGRLIVDV